MLGKHEVAGSIPVAGPRVVPVSYSGQYDRLVPDKRRFESCRRIQVLMWCLSFNSRTEDCGSSNVGAEPTRHPKWAYGVTGSIKVLQTLGAGSSPAMSTKFGKLA